MVRERFKEIIDFATAESPYRSANKGWISNDIYLQVGKSSSPDTSQGDQLADISVYAKPINEIVLILIGVFFLATVFVFSMISLSNGDLQAEAGNIPLTYQDSSSSSIQEDLLIQGSIEIDSLSEPKQTELEVETPESLLRESGLAEESEIQVNGPTLSKANMLQPKNL